MSYSIEEKLRSAYRDNEVSYPDNLVPKILEKYEVRRKPKVLKWIPATCIMILLAIVLSNSSEPENKTAEARDSIRDLVVEKTKEANLSQEEIDILVGEISRDILLAEELAEIEPLRRNENGQTYGPSFYHPDLILACATNGVEGYIYQTDFDGEMPNTPEEAVAMMETSQIRVINVYKSDGKTVVGEFVIQ